jgi:hypothetical protein
LEPMWLHQAQTLPNTWQQVTSRTWEGTSACGCGSDLWLVLLPSPENLAMEEAAQRAPRKPKCLLFQQNYSLGQQPTNCLCSGWAEGWLVHKVLQILLPPKPSGSYGDSRAPWDNSEASSVCPHQSWHQS